MTDQFLFDPRRRIQVAANLTVRVIHISAFETQVNFIGVKINLPVVTEPREFSVPAYGIFIDPYYQLDIDGKLHQVLVAQTQIGDAVFALSPLDQAYAGPTYADWVEYALRSPRPWSLNTAQHIGRRPQESPVHE